MPNHEGPSCPRSGEDDLPIGIEMFPIQFGKQGVPEIRQSRGGVRYGQRELSDSQRELSDHQRINTPGPLLRVRRKTEKNRTFQRIKWPRVVLC